MRVENHTMKTARSFWLSTIFEVLLIAEIAVHAWAYKILMVPLPGKSHVFSMAAMSEALANRGHLATLFIGENYRLNLPELRNRSEISVVRFKDIVNGVNLDYDDVEENLTKAAIQSRGDVKQLAAITNVFSQQWCQHLTVDNDDILERLEAEKFDVAVVDGIIFTKCVCLVPHRLRIPWITYTDAVDPLLVRVPWLPSFVPNGILPSSDHMSFIGRLRNVANAIFFSFMLPRFFPHPEHDVMEKFRRYGYFESLDELMSKSVLWFLTKDIVLDYPRPMMPNMVNVGGLTVKRSSGKLPPDIQNFIDGAKNGIILMTFGSIASSIPAHMVEKFSSAFHRLDGYRVIWRLNNRDDVKLPDNVIISQWLPQNDILAHPSVKLFITHSGNNGQYEAIYNGVPMIGFYLLGDQLHNAQRLDYKGYGLSMDLHHFTTEHLLNNIHKILEDKSYKERVMKASEIFRSQDQSPAERAAFWIEHVCRFGGDHLRSAGNDLPLYSYLMLDILAFVLIIVHILIYLLPRLLKLIVNECCGHTAANNTSKKSD